MSNGRIFVNHFRDISSGCANLIQWDRQIYSSWQQTKDRLKEVFFKVNTILGRDNYRLLKVNQWAHRAAVNSAHIQGSEEEAALSSARALHSEVCDSYGKLVREASTEPSVPYQNWNAPQNQIIPVSASLLKKTKWKYWIKTSSQHRY